MFDDIVTGFIGVFFEIVLELIFDVVLYFVGYPIVKILTFGKYPKSFGSYDKSFHGVVSFVGLLVVGTMLIVFFFIP